MRFTAECGTFARTGDSRMRLNLKPAKGWRAFAGEVGVIVLGVIIALAAQEAAEAVNEPLMNVLNCHVPIQSCRWNRRQRRERSTSSFAASAAFY